MTSKILPAIGLISAALNNFNPYPYDAGFDIEKVTQLAVDLPSHSWEFGATGEALIELENPQFSVFGVAPFPVANVSRTKVRALDYVANNVRLGGGSFDALDRGNGAAGDPASMGVFAVMLGKRDQTFANAARRTAQGLLEDVPRMPNGAISHRSAVPEVWADFMYMVPPFLAYYAADQEDLGLLRETVRQCRLYREILQLQTDEPYKGVWRHIIGPQSQDTGLWSSGNAWAAAGMTRVLATVMKAPVAATNTTWQQGAITQLSGYIKEILDGAMASSHDGGLLRNYYQDVGGPRGFGEISGSSLLAATAYRMAVLQPSTFGQRYITWAEGIRRTLGRDDRNGNPHVTRTGVVTPAVNPLGWLDTRPFTTGSPEGQAFVVLMYAAYRDCVYSAVCSRPQTEGSGSNFGSTGANGSTAGSRRMVKRNHAHRRAPHNTN
ncbi:hypothetical protein MD484_g1446, partial [Candolleomyces efflorescens]